MLGNVGPLEIGIVLIIALIVFGPKRLPELGNGLGRGLREFKQTVSGEKRGDLSENVATGPAATALDETASVPGAPSDHAGAEATPEKRGKA
jgi:sec-independent protein translocase protein TatA